MARAKRPTERNAPYLLLAVVAFLVLGGLVMVFSAASVTDYVTYGDSAHTLKRQLIYAALGVALMFFLSRIDFRRLRQGAALAVLLVDVGLIAVLAFGVERGGSTRFLEAGPVSLQPSEFAKIACVLALAVIMSEKGARAEALRLWRVLAVLPPMLVLIMIQPDMGTAMAILIASFLVMWLGGLSWGHTFTLAGAATAFTAIGIVLAPYRMARWLSFRDPWADPLGSGYQTVQAILAFASGGLFGVGLGMSRQKFSYLPEAHTDFILAIIGEELGLAGTLAVIAGFVLFAVAGFRIALSAKDRFGRLLAGGLTAMIVSQAVINMLAVTNLMPVTGIPLPFVSFGGNSMLVTMASVGLILSVSRSGARVTRSSEARAKVRKKAATRGGQRPARTAERRGDRGARLPRAVRRGRTRVRRA